MFPRFKKPKNHYPKYCLRFSLKNDVSFTEIGMDVQKARAAMMVGANAVRREQILSQNYYARLRAQQRRAELARRNQQILAARQRQQSYWARLGVSVSHQVCYDFAQLSKRLLQAYVCII